MNITNTILSLKPGLYIIRHTGGDNPPLSLTRTPASTGKLQSLSSRGDHELTLSSTAEALVLNVLDGNIELLVTAYGGRSTPTLRVDQIALDAPGNAPTQSAEPPSAPQTSPSVAIPEDGLLIAAHVERQGDVLAAPGSLLGQKEGLQRIEGFQLEWLGRPEGVDIAYCAQIEGQGYLPLVKSGNFSGTRHAAQRITGLMFQLTGQNASQHLLSGHAYFSGGFALPITSGTYLSGPSGAEHLIGLAIKTEKIPEASVKNATSNMWEASKNTKVFKKGAKLRS